MNISDKITLLNQTTLESLNETDKLQIIGRFTETGLKILGGDFGFAYWKQDSDETFSLAYKSPNMAFEPRLPRADGYTSMVEKSRKPYLALVYKEENPEYDLSIYMKSIAIVPVFYKEYQYGDIVICFSQEKFFSEEYSSLATALGNAAAQAITINRLLISEHSARVAAERQQERFRALIENSYDIICLLDAQGVIVDVSNSVARITGYRPRDLLGRNLIEFIHADDIEAIQEHMEETLRQSGTALTVEARYRHGDGSWRWLEASGVNMLDNPSVGGIVANIRDITERKKIEQTVKWQAMHDPLTALPNRQEFGAKFDQALQQAKRQGRQLALMFLDMDRLKNINDNLGHTAGDSLLRVAASRICSCLRSEDIAARFGGDEFLILINEVASAKAALAAAEKILKALSLPIKLGEHTIYPSTSIGIALYPEDGLDCDSLKRKADTALYRVKQSGRNRAGLYDRSLDSRGQEEQFILENELRQAVPLNQMEVYYQPIVSLGRRKLIAVEALARWRHPRRGLLPPGEFIPLAEQSGVIGQIDSYVLGEACRQAAAWQEMGLPKFRLAVNLSAEQFSEPDFISVISQILAQNGLAPENLRLEITESLAMGNLELTGFNLQALKKSGIQVTIDDFGTGYSSLSYLKRFPLHSLKIDKSFIRHCIINSQDTSITKTIVGMAKILNLKVVAEGVETAEQFDFLASLGCDAAQGFFIARPMPAAEAASWIAGKNPLRRKTPVPKIKVGL